jgi:short-subunit dehydrogenase
MTSTSEGNNYLVGRGNRLNKRYGSWGVVTGASSGIGYSIARCLAKSGINLVLVARSKDVLEDYALELRSLYKIETKVAVIDLAVETGIKALDLMTHELDVGLLVAAAGFGSSGSFLNASLEHELSMLAVNCQSLMALTWYFGRRFSDRRRGGIVLLSSIVAFQGMPNASHYAATKSYVQTLGEALHYELAPVGVDVLTSAPGVTQTNFAHRANMKVGSAMSPEIVAEETLKALGRKITVFPGLLSKILFYSLSPLPRWLRVKIMGNVMYGMTRH